MTARDKPGDGSPDAQRPAPARKGAGRQHGVSIRDVARLAGVSAGTASRVLSGSTYPVSDRARRRVEEAAQRPQLRHELGRARPRHGPQRDRRGDRARHHRPLLQRGRARPAGRRRRRRARRAGRQRRPRRRQARELPHHAAQPEADRRGADRRPAPRPGRHPAGGPRRAAPARAGRAGRRRRPLRARHTARGGRRRGRGRVRRRAPGELGHRQIAFLGGPLNSTTVQDRYSGYSAALMRVGEPLDERLVVQTPLTLEGGAQAVGAPGRRRRALHGHLRRHRRGRLRRHVGAARARPAAYRATSAWWASTTSSCRRTATRRSPPSTCRPASSAWPAWRLLKADDAAVGAARPARAVRARGARARPGRRARPSRPAWRAPLRRAAPNAGHRAVSRRASVRRPQPPSDRTESDHG